MVTANGNHGNKLKKIEKDIIRHENIFFAPALHGRLEFGAAVHRLFHGLKPQAIALEYPPTVSEPFLQGIRRLPYLSVVLYQEKDGQYVYLPLEPQDAMTAAARLALAHDVPLFFVDRDTEGYPRVREPMPDPYTVTRLGLAAYAETYRRLIGDTGSLPEDHLREVTMACHLQDLAGRYERVLFVCGLTHYPAVRRLLGEHLALPLGRTYRKGVTLANLAEASSREIMSEMPFLAARFVRAGQNGEKGTLDRLALHQDLLAQAGERHLKNSKEQVSPAQMSVINRFSRNYSLVQGYLTPDLYQLLIAARGAVDDNFAYEIWDLATHYPWQEENSGLPTLRLRGEDLYLDQKKIRFYRRFRHFRRRLVSVPVKKRKKEKVPGQWQREWEGKYICSYPPEDIIIEGYGDYLKKKVTHVLSEENRRTQPFLASMLDGIDLRESIRNWHEGRLYVTENRPVQGRVGSVVGEHNQESDMALYATPAGAQVIGPGVSRCEYGGFMMTYPPLRVYDIWQDPFFNGTRTKAERLLMAGIDYSKEKFVAYIAARPPASRMKSLANHYGKKIIYLPLGQFSPVMLKKIRVFHVLDGQHVRAYARDFIY